MSIVFALLLLLLAALGCQRAESGWPIDMGGGCGLALLPVWRDANRQGEFTQQAGRAVTRAPYLFIRVRTMSWRQYPYSCMPEMSDMQRRRRLRHARRRGSAPHKRR